MEAKRILMVNKFHYLKGGSEKYYFELANLLKENGHEVAFFSMEDEKNIHTNCKEYFAKSIDLNSNNKLKAFDIIYSKTNKKKMEEALDDFQPDIVHLNNFQRQLSASIIEPIKERNIPIVFTAHDLQAICPAITMLDSEKRVCEKCMNGKYINCIKNNCIKDSKLKSLLGAIEAKYYRNNKIFSEKIDYIIAPSEFVKNELVKDGIRKDKIYSMHNFIELKDYELQTSDEGYALYIGRLSREKGILNLIKAFKSLKNQKLYIAGIGPEEDNIINIIKNEKLEKNIKLLGFIRQDQVKEYISKAKFIVIPSICNENCPYSALETFAIGKPIIGANIGGIPELIKENETGLLYKYDNINELAEKMNYLYDNKELTEKMGKRAKIEAKENYSKEKYYDEIIKIYNKIIEEKN